MPVITFTAGDSLQTLVVNAGTYLSDIIKIEGPKAAKSGNSVNYIVTVRIIQEGPYKGKEKDLVLNSNVKTPMDNEDGSRLYGQNTFLEIDAAVRGVSLTAEPRTVDTDALIGKPFASVWAVTTAGGKLVNQITGFLPAGAENTKPAF